MKNTSAFTIAEFESIDHGIDHAQYFQGCGVSHSHFDHVTTGCGSNAAEAWDDALEQIAMSHDVDLSPIESSEENTLFTSEKAEAANVEKHFADCGEEMGEECEHYYYLSIRYNLEAVAPFVPVSAMLPTLL